MKASTLLLLSTSFLSTAQAAYNLPKQPIKSYECDVCARLSHEHLQDKWEINATPLNNKVSNAQKSYGYRVIATLEELQNGFAISTLAPGAVVRITPMQNKSVPAIKIKTPANKLLSLEEASTLYSEDEGLSENDAKTKQTMLQIKPELGAGRFVIKTTSRGKKTDAYVINVFDKFSYTYLEVSTDSIHYQYGDRLTATISLKDDDTDYDLDSIEVSLINPAGEAKPMELTKVKRNLYQASTELLSVNNDHGENWYVEATVQSSSKINVIRRSGHAAFSYAVPSATLLNIKKLTSKPLTFVATLDVATPSRYALQSVLFRKANVGEAKPIETSQKAQWLDAGKQVIQFTFDNHNELTDDHLYLGYLRLIDYGQLKTVYQYNQPIKLSKLVD